MITRRLKHKDGTKQEVYLSYIEPYLPAHDTWLYDLGYPILGSDISAANHRGVSSLADRQAVKAFAMIQDSTKTHKRAWVTPVSDGLPVWDKMFAVDPKYLR